MIQKFFDLSFDLTLKLISLTINTYFFAVEIKFSHRCDAIVNKIKILNTFGRDHHAR